MFSVTGIQGKQPDDFCSLGICVDWMNKQKKTNKTNKQNKKTKQTNEQTNKQRSKKTLPPASNVNVVALERLVPLFMIIEQGMDWQSKNIH